MSLDMELVAPTEIITSRNDTLVDLVDGLLSHGVVIRGELWLTVADVELVFLGVDLVLAAPDIMKRTTVPL